MIDRTHKDTDREINTSSTTTGATACRTTGIILNDAPNPSASRPGATSAGSRPTTPMRRSPSAGYRQEYSRNSGPQNRSSHLFVIGRNIIIYLKYNIVSFAPLVFQNFLIQHLHHRCHQIYLLHKTVDPNTSINPV